VTKTVLLRADGELSGAQSDRLKAANAAALAQANLARIVGIPQGFELREEPYVEGELQPLAFYRETAEKERSDLKSLEIQKKISEDQVRFTKGSYWPSLSLAAVYAGADQDPASSTINRESIYGAALLNFPFFEGGLRKAEVKEAMARERQTNYFYEDLRKAIGIEVESAYLEIATQKGQIRFLRDQLAYARDNFNAVSRQFEYGLSSSIDVIDANTLLVSAEQKLAEALYSYQTSTLKLKKATGVLLRAVTGPQG
jgi:outer membrane protein